MRFRRFRANAAMREDAAAPLAQAVPMTVLGSAQDCRSGAASLPALTPQGSGLALDEFALLA